MALVLFLGSGLSLADNNGNILGGDQGLACEAILCLSSGTRPNECQRSLNRYFSINEKKISDTIRARKNFLQLCPSSNDKGMPDLVNAIANGAGRCDARELNRVMRRSKIVRKCEKTGLWGKEVQCFDETIHYIQPSKPAYCHIYENQEFTATVDPVRYVGEIYPGGRWVDK